TGRVNVGCVGWVLRNGEAVGRVATIPLAGTLSTVMRAVTAVGDDTEQIPFTPVRASTVLCDGQLLAPAP
ncbi:MAG TPA: metallopeptidase TldD-related protein, partial [Nocardioidaceae bacterium]|nr:metallopeptidase TldD-related protein [Nocardioidaceae bacterium]